MSSGERVQAGKTVCLDYTLRLANGTLIDSAQQSGTWTYVHGHTRMPPGLHRGVLLHAASSAGLFLRPTRALPKKTWASTSARRTMALRVRIWA